MKLKLTIPFINVQVSGHSRDSAPPTDGSWQRSLGPLKVKRAAPRQPGGPAPTLPPLPPAAPPLAMPHVATPQLTLGPETRDVGTQTAPTLVHSVAHVNPRRIVDPTAVNPAPLTADAATQVEPPKTTGVLKRLKEEHLDAGSATAGSSSGSLASSSIEPSTSRAAADLRLHQAVQDGDIGKVKALVAEGLRPVNLDGGRRSPLDLLGSVESTDLRKALHAELLRSANPSAPSGYAKPEAFHGSPWTLEILVGGELKGGTNDPKGGMQSLEGKVFFSDRTPSSAAETTTRTDLRKNARTYSNGDGWRSSAASSRAFQHRLAQAMLQSIAEGRPLNATGKQVAIACADAKDVQQKVQDHLQEILNRTGPITLPKFANATPSQMADAVKLPTSLLLNIEGRAPQEISGDALVGAYRTAAEQLKASLENGKAPYLALLNEGRVVPVVFGFERIEGLKAHTIQYKGAKGSKDYSYQAQSHPLAGSDQGGRLKEIEVTGLQDLATLCLGAAIKGVPLPEDAVVRVKPRGKDAGKATYLAPDQVQAFRDRVASEAAKAVGAAPAELAQATSTSTMEQLQALNRQLRDGCSAEWSAK